MRWIGSLARPIIHGMKAKSVWLVTLVLVTTCQAQEPNSKSKSSTPAPSLGFNKIKDVSPIIDSDALMEENELKEEATR